MLNRGRSSRVGLIVVAVVGLAAVDAGRAVEPPADADPSAIVATVGTEPIRRADLDAVLQRVGTGGADGLATPPPHVQAAALEQLIDQRLLRAEIERDGITVGNAEIEVALGKLRGQMKARGLEWGEFLAKTGRDEDFLRRQIALELGLDKLIKPRLGAQAVEAAFQKHRRELDGTQLRVSHVILRPDIGLGDDAVQDSLRRAAQIRGAIVRGEISFAEAARRHSVGPSRLRGGDLGWISRKQPCVEEFGRIAYTLAKGDVSQPFTTACGVHVVMVTDMKPGQLGLDAVRPQVESILASEVLRERLARARAATRIDYAPGVPHLDPKIPRESGQSGRVIVEPPG